MGPMMMRISEDEDDPLAGRFATPDYTMGVSFEDDKCVCMEFSTLAAEPDALDVSREIGDPPVISCHLLLRLVDDAVTMLRSLCFVTHALVGRPDTVKDRVRLELYEKLRSYADRVKAWEKAELGKFEEAEKALSNSAKALCFFFLQKNQNAERELEALQEQPAEAVALLLELFQRLRAIAVKRLSTSLEEQECIDGYRQDIDFRLEKATKTNAMVQQLLDADRNKRAEEYAQYQEEERIISQDGEMSTAQALALDKQLDADCAALEEQEFHIFDAEGDVGDGQHSVLVKENVELQEDVVYTQGSDRERELQQRGKNGQSVEEVADLLWVYENDIQEKTAALALFQEENHAVSEKLKKMEAFFVEKERLAAIKAEEERIRIENICARMRRKWLPYFAVCRIQRYWRSFQKRKHAGEEPEGGKGKKGKGKKGSKGGKKKK